MRAKRDYTNILSIEAAVGGGSLALMTEGRATLVKQEGNLASRAEKIILVIEAVLDEAGLSLADLDMIAVSTGPGSYSGIRIGMATALGLGNALKIPCVGVSVLAAMAHVAGSHEPLIAAIPVGKNDVAFQPFESTRDGIQKSSKNCQLVSVATFVENLKNFPGFTVFAQTDLLRSIVQPVPKTRPWIDAGTGLAEFVGSFASLQQDLGSLARPIYLRNGDLPVRPNSY
ncbi:MAG: tRNA (adenosine(37)-N6)-threonylcarbamoyltransferase complex dimerization subunit type 1 TsaB [Acidobacteriota bacterium]